MPIDMLTTEYELVLSFLLSLTAWVFVNKLQDEGMIFEWYYRLLEKIPEWLAHPLGKCDRCLAGQFAFWVFFLVGAYHPVRHVFFVMLAIFFTGVFDFLDRKFYG